jgi:hypothetical protein
MSIKEQKNENEESVVKALLRLSKLSIKLSKLYDELAVLESVHAKASHSLFVKIQDTMDEMDAILIEEVLGEDLTQERN